MATYTELFGIIHDSALRNKITVAVGVAADAIWDEDPETENHVNRLLWAAQVFTDPVSMARRIMWAVIIANRAQSVGNIQGADDSTIQANVDAIVNLFATGA